MGLDSTSSEDIDNNVFLPSYLFVFESSPKSREGGRTE